MTVIVDGTNGITSSGGDTNATLSSSTSITTPILKSTTANAATFQNTSGVQIGILCRAWIYLYDNGTTVTINNSFNVANVTRTATCDYTINFTNAMPSANYAVVGTAGLNTTSMRNVALPWNTTPPGTGSFRIQIVTADGSLGPNGVLCVSVFA
jgi:hypothetical protein